MKKIYPIDFVPALKAGNAIIFHSGYAAVLDDILKEYRRQTAASIIYPDFWQDKALIRGKYYLLQLEAVGENKRGQKIAVLHFWGACKALREHLLDETGGQIAGIASCY